MKVLKQFYDDANMRESVKDFFKENLNLLALEKVFSNESVVGLNEANQVIDKTFAKLEELYSEKENNIVDSPR